jgi:hypothetical protein
MNLYHALTELRRQKLQFPLRADQVCINQHDSEEKVAQLGIMVDIFRSATCVTIWLGKLSMARNNTLDFIERLSGAPQWPVQLPLNSESMMNMNKLSRSLDSLSSFSSSIGEQYHCLGVALVIGRQWFSRS